MMNIVGKKDIPEMIRAIMGAGVPVFAPVADGKYSAFRQITDPAQAALEIRNTKIPLKEMFLPSTECILKYKNEDGNVSIGDCAPPEQERAVFGARPCDAASLPIMDKVFTWDYMDSFYLSRRKNTTIVTIACKEKAPWCRCEDLGLSPTSRQGADVILIPAENDSYTMEALTEKGVKLLSRIGRTSKIAVSADAAVPAEIPIIKMEISMKSFDSPAWAEATMKCLGCGVCAYVCPTCHCFDIVDEKGGGGGERRRNWDACAFDIFTLHGSMHNPRPVQWQRYRQRVMHKFAYYKEKFGVTACVGCGRCLQSCPVGMDIFEVMERVSSNDK